MCPRRSVEQVEKAPVSSLWAGWCFCRPRWIGRRGRGRKSQELDRSPLVTTYLRASIRPNRAAPLGDKHRDQCTQVSTQLCMHACMHVDEIQACADSHSHTHSYDQTRISSTARVQFRISYRASQLFICSAPRGSSGLLCLPSPCFISFFRSGLLIFIFFIFIF